MYILFYSKAIEQDRRHAESFQRLDLDTTYVDRILTLASETDEREGSLYYLDCHKREFKDSGIFRCTKC